MTADESGALFDVPELAADPARLGRVEAAVYAALRAGADAGTVLPEDAGLAAGALVAARALDVADRMMSNPTQAKAAGYLVAQLLTPYREALHALRLPAELTPASPPAPNAGNGQDELASWLGDAFGPA